MSAQLTLRDRMNGQATEQALVLDWQESVLLTARTLIAERVRLEWEAGEAMRAAEGRDGPAPLVSLEMMRRLNPFRSPQEAAPAATDAPSPVTTDAPPVTLESITALAHEGFRRNAFFLLVDGRQVTDLDEVIAFRPRSDVTFVRLVQLKGG